MYYTLKSFISTTINSNDSVMKMVYWFALIPCISAACTKGKRFFRYPLFHIILNSVGGGWLRDTTLLFVKPWVLTLQAIPDLLYIAIIGILYSYITDIERSEKATQINDYVVNTLDAIGLADFIAIGVDKAISLGFNAQDAIISGYLTASGGGCLAYFMTPRAIFTKKNCYYHFVVFMNSLLYFHLQNAYVNCIIIPIFLLIGNINYRALSSEGYYECVYSVSKIDLIGRIHSLRAFFAKVTARAAGHFVPKRMLHYPRVYLTFHRLRFCS